MARTGGPVDVKHVAVLTRFSPEQSSVPKKREASPTPEQLAYRELEVYEQFQSSHRRKKALRAQRNMSARYNPNTSQTYHAASWTLEQAPITDKGWQRVNIRAMERNEIRDLLLVTRSPKLMNILARYQLVYYNTSDQLATRILDASGRLFIYRSRLSEWQRKLLPSLASAIKDFTEMTQVSEDDHANNKRGSHKFCIAGIDRQSKEKPAECNWHRKGRNSLALQNLFQTEAMQAFNSIASDLVRRHFPKIASRMEGAHKSLQQKYGIPDSPFGLFHNFCINSPVFEEGIEDVFCIPHTDAQNATILVCAVLVYYYGQCHTNADERIWLVFWDTGIIMQVPAGVFVIYPSALFLHFNVHIEDVLMVTKDGSFPTRENTIPFRESSRENGGRGSIVRFTQASMFISAELPADSIKQAEQLNAEAHSRGVPLINTFFDDAQALREGFFPYNV
ncbi:hypothetical protein BDY19DRAFT_996879 [Irpex rosettiformis]|uniref:Uncharacterized protein n=1 Tax=Irpex rosettiformis TaxID=378272 RepID=A0ACB8TTS7_9APHY|nr:hypothetical protein BDY19DRAFT_996879 [Irpex rosettiformis]